MPDWWCCKPVQRRRRRRWRPCTERPPPASRCCDRHGMASQPRDSQKSISRFRREIGPRENCRLEDSNCRNTGSYLSANQRVSRCCDGSSRRTRWRRTRSLTYLPLKDFSRSHAVTDTVKVVISRKRCKTSSPLSNPPDPTFGPLTNLTSGRPPDPTLFCRRGPGHWRSSRSIVDQREHQRRRQDVKTSVAVGRI